MFVRRERDRQTDSRAKVSLANYEVPSLQEAKPYKLCSVRLRVATAWLMRWVGVGREERAL